MGIIDPRLINRRQLIASSVGGGLAIALTNDRDPGRQQSALAQGDSANVPTYRGNSARTGEMPGPGPNHANGLEILWQFTASKGQVGAPAVVDGVVYLPSSGQGNGLYALDALNGTELWRLGDDSGSSTPVVQDGVVYVGIWRSIYALNAQDGTQRWRYQLANGSSPLAVVENVVYGTGWGTAYAVSADDGSELWRFATENDQEMSPPVVVDNTVYVAGGDNRLNALNAEDGTKRWEYLYGETSLAPAVSNGVIYIGEDGILRAVDVEDLTERWTVATPYFDDWFSSAAVVDDAVYVSAIGDQGTLLALNTDDGTERWRFAEEHIFSSPVVADGVVYINSGGTIVAVNAIDGIEQWRYTLPGSDSRYDNDPFEGGSLVVVNGIVYAGGSPGGTLYAIGAPR